MVGKFSITVCISLGAIISNRGGSIDANALSSIGKQLQELINEHKFFKVIVVAGAGGLGGEYVAFAKRNFGQNENLDRIGIEASGLNALLLCNFLYGKGINVNLTIPRTLQEVKNYLRSDLNVVSLGGLKPGMTSDSTSAFLAKEFRSSLIILATARGIFESASQRKTLAMVNRGYLRKIIRSKPSERVLDAQTCSILLERKSRGKKVLVTGYKNLGNAVRSLESLESWQDLERATRILI